MSTDDYQAWNNFVMRSDPFERKGDSIRRAAAIANSFMGAANNGGLNSFLTVTWELGSQEVVEALRAVGAIQAAEQLDRIISGLGGHLPACTQQERWDLLEEKWTDDLNELDVLEEQADAELMRVLERHVAENRDYYLQLR